MKKIINFLILASLLFNFTPAQAQGVNRNFLVIGQSNGLYECPYLQDKAEIAFPNDTITVICSAVGGTHIAEWQEGAPRGLYEDMLEDVNGRPIDLIVIWQGEEDTVVESDAKNHRYYMLELILDLREDIGPAVPIIIMNLGLDPHADPDFGKYWWTVYACIETFNGLTGLPTYYRVKVLQTFHIQADPNSLGHKTPAGYRVAGNNIISKYKNMMGIP